MSNEFKFDDTIPSLTLEPELEKLRAEAAPYVKQEEDVLTYAMFPQVAPKFFAARDKKEDTSAPYSPEVVVTPVN